MKISVLESLCCVWDNKKFTFQIAKYFGVGGIKL